MFVHFYCVFIFPFNEHGFEPRTNSFEEFSHTKLARQPPNYYIIVPTPLG